MRTFLVSLLLAGCAHAAPAAKPAPLVVEEHEPPPTEPERLVIRRPNMVPVTIPNPFVRLGDCPEGTTRFDDRKRGVGELSCKRPDGTRHGPYARNDAGKPVPRYAFIGKAERGRFEGGQRVGRWYVVHWGPGMVVHVERVEYEAGREKSRRTVTASGPGHDVCLSGCAQQRDECQRLQDACPPGAPCLYRNCPGRHRDCRLRCETVEDPVW